jgi:hypothetical protein
MSGCPDGQPLTALTRVRDAHATSPRKGVKAGRDRARHFVISELAKNPDVIAKKQTAARIQDLPNLFKIIG